MSGGTAYVLDEAGHFDQLHNAELTERVRLSDDTDINALKALVFRHFDNTDSAKARHITDNWTQYEPQFYKVQPKTPVPTPEPLVPAGEPAKV